MSNAPLDSIASMFSAIQNAVSDVGAGMETPALALLGACTAIVIVKEWMESFGDADAMGWVMKSAQIVVYATIAAAVIKNFSSIVSYTFSLMYGVMALFGGVAGGSGGSGQNIPNIIWDQTTAIAQSIFNFTMKGGADTSGVSSAGDAVAGAANILTSGVDMAISWILTLIAIVLILIYMGVMLLQLVQGFFMVAIGLVWLPITTGFFPVIENWMKNAIGVITGGIAHMAIVSFMLSIVSRVATQLTDGMGNSTGAIFTVPSMTTGEINSKALASLVLCLVLVMLAMAAGTAIKKAAEIFGTSSGMMRVATPKGSSAGGGKTGKTGSEASKSVGKGAAEAAGNVASGAATAAAGVATGGAASVAMGVAKQAAATYAKTAMRN